MLRLTALSLGAFACALLACQADNPAPAAEQPSAPPAWFSQPPCEPGRAFYGVGTGMYNTPEKMQLALTYAQQAARRQIADSMKVNIAFVFKHYMRRVTENTGEAFEDGMALDYIRAITDFALSGAEIIKTEYSNPDANGFIAIYCLARFGFDSVAANQHKELFRLLQEQRERENRPAENAPKR